MSYEETEGIGKAREGKGVRGVEGQCLLSEVGVLGKVMPLMMDIQNWQGGHAGDGVHKQVYAMSCLSDVIRNICSLQD